MSSKKPTNLNNSGNTLFNYFSRSPSTPKSDKPAANSVASPLVSKPGTPTSSKTGAAGKLKFLFEYSFHVDRKNQH